MDLESQRISQDRSHSSSQGLKEPGWKQQEHLRIQEAWGLQGQKPQEQPRIQEARGLAGTDAI